ncbi:MAG: 4a-hydroxytetrahydrobiopterin dehydratase [Parcubacteria group bacterium Gr01-1014_73]|nr:MAG: 4a-hydroxytetrahydrobiopterin dehydratase [Parcubacteria group bacterium Gr01-1014_73]
MTDLVSKKCSVCEVGGLPLSQQQAKKFLAEISGWRADAEFKKISKKWQFPDFKMAMVFADKVAILAEVEGHHPELCIAWGEVKVLLWTHAVGGLSENDFILAAKIDKLT